MQMVWWVQGWKAADFVFTCFIKCTSHLTMRTDPPQLTLALASKKFIISKVLQVHTY